MNFEIQCSCGQRIAVASEHIGHSIRCPGCGATVVVPAPAGAPVEIEQLPTLRAEPVFSSYTLPPPAAPSLWSQYKAWVLAGAGVVLLVVLFVASVVGFVWVSKFIEPATPGALARPASESGAGSAGQTGSQPLPAEQAGQAPPTDGNRAAPGTKADDEEEFE